MKSSLQALGAVSQSVGSIIREHARDRFLLILMVISAVLAGIYVIACPIGFPGDEPSHYHTVLYYARHWSLPILGRPHVSYEGQMGPVYYYLAAIWFTLVQGLGLDAGFYLLRLLSVVMAPIIVFLSYRICYECTANIDLSRCTAAFLALNPSLAAINSSIQNDSLTILISGLSTLAVFRLIDSDNHQWKELAGLGLLISLGVLTKASMVYFPIAFCLFVLLTKPRRFISSSFVVSIFVFLGTGWWFVRNVMLYGDATAQKALTYFHYNNNPPPTDLTVPSNLFHWLWVIESYYWLPIQYYRDAFHAPQWLRIDVGLLTACGIAGFAILLRQLKAITTDKAKLKFLFLFLQYFVCMLVYTYSCMKITHFAPRVTFATIFAFALIVGSGSKLLRWNRAFIFLLMAGLILANVYVVRQAIRLPNLFQKETAVYARSILGQ